ncbi:MAG TPA: DmsE family decaheme c-type cytochrome [Candidatus Acidoferrum sp.]|nr:DmsE family decaheme c-type cytochrome [Candidatus Acidoferrum sp.]
MKGVRRRKPRTIFIAGLILFFMAAVVSFGGQAPEALPASKPQAAPTTNQPQAAPAKSATEQKAFVREQDPSLYVGSETCKTCHADMPSTGFFQKFEDSPHFATTLDTKKGPEWHGCEGCHGPGKEHVDGGGDKTKIFKFEDASAREINAVCLGCHVGGPQHMNTINSEHAKNEVSCISCHSPHHAKESEFLLVKSQPELCYTCHLTQKAQFDMPFHHRVNEGLVQCSDCHNVHGTVAPKQVRTSSTQDAVCFKCHTDKQGPFVYEHAPVKVDGCQSCHLTHGGPNPHMLKLSNLNLLCLQCHTTSSFSSAPGMPSFHNQATLFQSCVLCHTAIHGSNFDATFFK